MSSFLRRTRDRWSTDQADREQLADEAARVGCPLIASTPARSLVSVHGELRAVTLRPRGGVSALEAELYDGSDAVTLVWLGRHRITGIAAGRRLTAHGRMGERGGARVIYNPRYELDA